jgi:hypothetical protein
MRHSRYLCLILIILILLAPTACGRKKPPLPPKAPDPVEVNSIRFEGDIIVAKVQNNIQGSKIILLGKPKGICPSCTDDLKEITQITAATKEQIILEDKQPVSPYMVYRIKIEMDGSRFLTEPFIVVK